MSMENKHTPGPWKSVATNYHDGRMIWSDKIVNGDQKHIANVFTTCCDGLNGHELGRYSRVEREEMEANTKLIAAAPDMLHLLMEADAWLSFNTSPSADEILKFRKSIQDAIKKATE